MNLASAVDATRERWVQEAELNFARDLLRGVKMVRKLWANGQWMVGNPDLPCNRHIPLAMAIKIFHRVKHRAVTSPEIQRIP